MGHSGRLGAVEDAALGTLAEDTLDYDEDAGVLALDGSLLSETVGFLVAGVGGVVLMLAGTALTFAGADGWARWTLGAGAALVLLVLAMLLVLRYAPDRPAVEFRLAEGVAAYRGATVPLAELEPAHLAWRGGRVFKRLHLRHPLIRRRIAAFFAGEADAAEEFRERLWELLSEPHLPGPATPVQRWILGAGALYGAINGFRLDRLGGDPSPEGALADGRAALELLQEPWNVYDLDQLLAAVTWLVQDGHRADFAQDADLAARPAAEQDEYARLLREVDGLIAEDRMEPPFVERLIELVRVRYGTEGEVYAKLVPSLLRDEPGADASEEGAALAQFLGQLFNDRDHAAEELHRLDVLADPGLRANTGRFLIWDYSRALMLYRWGHMAGWLTERYCWDRMLPLARDIQRGYGSWQDMATCYLQGRRLWSGADEEARAEYDRLMEELTGDSLSPWNLVPWDLDLRDDWS
ncbi:DUF1266 domain-containing protein [Actinomadura parmotrematis]|uniref:DUF1266 domain-containing protein n=1 Tax=Actinomadura parmotrematis TaxID=2864039 RepID=A0ABS7FYA6_9ACTN|nr:DUF1266 domain-containing protein [Actinomadura parmotrematis]MBW8485296.1 DUF1266 domain-containing protein [Actinomadura parmotrematis]